MEKEEYSGAAGLDEGGNIMVKGTLKYEDTIFNAEGDFGMIMITTAGDHGVSLESASFGKGNVIETAYALGQGMGNTLNALAGKNLAKQSIVWNTFVRGMIKYQEGDRK